MLYSPLGLLQVWSLILSFLVLYKKKLSPTPHPRGLIVASSESHFDLLSVTSHSLFQSHVSLRAMLFSGLSLPQLHGLEMYFGLINFVFLLQAYIEKEDSKKLKQKQRERMQPKMGKMDIDYQVYS